MHDVNPADILAFARREWLLAEDQKANFWADRKHTLSPVEAIRLGDELRRHALALRPDWPNAEERTEDHAAHCRVSEALRAVDLQRTR